MNRTSLRRTLIRAAARLRAVLTPKPSATLKDALARNRQAAAALDAAVKEMLEQ